MIARTLFKTIQSHLFQKKIIILYGARQVGKTTLCKEVMSRYPDSHYITCDDPTIIQTLENQWIEQLKRYYGKYKLLIIDEAQRVSNIGLTLKMMVDNFPDLQIIATWSSSFELANKVNEPLTGRCYIFHLYPLSMSEIWSSDISFHTLEQSLEQRILHGMYPNIVTTESTFDLRLLSEQYLYKDVLIHQDIKKSPLLLKILQALAFQVWSEVSYNELGKLLWVDTNTIIKYIRLLEQSFVVFSLPSFSRNMRNELKRTKKYYFRDTGIRNGLLQNFSPLELRTDKWALRENFVIVERIKYLHNQLKFPNLFFWRTTTQQEIDFIEESNGILHTYEIKYSPKAKAKLVNSFATAYPNHSFDIINTDTLRDYIGL